MSDDKKDRDQPLTRRDFLIRSAAVGAGLALSGAGLLSLSEAQTATGQPNILLIITDDHRWDAMGCSGHPFLQTPNMDRLAAEGVRFTNSFATTSLCSPSRASILTGLYAHNHGVTINSMTLNPGVVTFPELLQQAGYDSAFMGKWHLGNAIDPSPGNAIAPRPGFNRWVCFRRGAYFDPEFNIDGEVQTVRGYVTDILTDFAIEWLLRPRSQPFFVMLSHKAPHSNYDPARRHTNLYEGLPIPRRKNVWDTLEGKPKWVRRRSKGSPSDEHIRNYFRTLVAVDEGMGEIFSTLEALGQMDNTLIIFVGDNGFCLGEHGLTGKQIAYEESIRIPLLMRYPGLAAPGFVCEELALNIDLAPTILDLSGAGIHPQMQGMSLRSLLSGQQTQWREEFLYEFLPKIQAKIQGVRTRRWKYVTYPDRRDIDELYDLAADPFEMLNLSRDPAFRSQMRSLRGRLERLLQET
ncbi:MAG: sulfatase [Thermodesulfovibrionales bacterium]|jgi:N-acetylglucosamine-6-sulfatase